MAGERRAFLIHAFRWLVAMAGFMMADASPAGAQNGTRPSPPARLPDPEPVILDPHKILEADEKLIKKDCELLLKLAQELKDEVDKTDSANVLSLPLISKAEEIEKLARKIRNLARAS